MKKILVAGDVEGHFDLLISKIQSFKEKNQEFDFCLCVGKTFSSHEDFSAYKTQKKNFPIPIYFIDSSELAPVLLTLYPDGTELCNNFHFLGKNGLKNIQGLGVAYLSGSKSKINPDLEPKLQKYNPGLYFSKDINSILIQKENSEFKSGVDILLTSEWPSGFDSNIQTQFEKKVEHLSESVSTLAKFLKPRYHFVGLENNFFKRAPYSNGDDTHITRLISIGKVPKDANVPAKQYLFALQIKKFGELTQEEILTKTVDTTSNPYIKTSLEIKRGPDSYKLQKTEEEEKVPDFEELKENIALYFTGFDKRSKDMDIAEFINRWGEVKDF
jgi:hypothetical protein